MLAAIAAVSITMPNNVSLAVDVTTFSRFSRGIDLLAEMQHCFKILLTLWFTSSKKVMKVMEEVVDIIGILQYAMYCKSQTVEYTWCRMQDKWQVGVNIIRAMSTYAEQVPIYRSNWFESESIFKVNVTK